MNLAPILLFTYKRLDTLQKTVESLKRNELSRESTLYIFSDGPKKEADIFQISEVRKYLNTIIGFKNVIIHESVTNKGLANSIIEGVTQIINKYGKVIVLEDDLLLTPNFLVFMNASLNKFQLVNSIFSISGFSFNLGIAQNEQFDAYFLNRGWSWGWATWQDRWKNIDWEVSNYDSFKLDMTARKKFSKGGSDLNKMLDYQMSGKLDSWAIRWFYHQFSIGGLSIYPIHSKVLNNGFGKEATHTTGSVKRYIPVLDNSNKLEFQFPEVDENNPYYQNKFKMKMGWFARLISKIQTIFGIS